MNYLRICARIENQPISVGDNCIKKETPHCDVSTLIVWKKITKRSLEKRGTVRSSLRPRTACGTSDRSPTLRRSA